MVLREEVLRPLHEYITHGLLLASLVEFVHWRKHALGSHHAELHREGIDVAYLTAEVDVHLFGLVAKSGHHIAHLLLRLVLAHIATVEAVGETRRHYTTR